MLEIGVSMEKEKSCKLGDRRDDEFSDISFEELLAQEKKDSFWSVMFHLLFADVKSVPFLRNQK